MPKAESGDVTLYYEMSGLPDGDFLMLSNSLGSNLRMWDKVVQRFEEHYRVLRYDTRGHGKSSVPQGPYTIDKLGNDTIFLLDFLGVQRANVCGLSLGGMLALWMGIHAAQRVRRMILANTGARIGTTEMWDARIEIAQTSGLATIAALNLERWFTPSYRNLHPDEMETIRGMIAATDVNGYIGCCGVLRDTDLRAGLDVIAIPTLVITGSHDPATPPSNGQYLHARLRNSRYVELDSSHLSAWERANEFGDAAIAFLGAEENSHG